MPEAKKIAEKSFREVDNFMWSSRLPPELRHLQLPPNDQALGYYLNKLTSFEDSIVVTQSGWFPPFEPTTFCRYKDIASFRFREDFKTAPPSEIVLDVYMSNEDHHELPLTGSRKDIYAMHDFLRRCRVFSQKW